MLLNTKVSSLFPRKWRSKGLTSWCIIERFKFTKYMTNLDIRSWYFDETGENKRSHNVLTNFISEQIDYNILEMEEKYIKEHFQNSLLKGKYFKNIPEELIYCPLCMSKGRHYIEQQILPVESCIYHPKQKLLKGECPNPKCNKKLYYTQFSKNIKEENSRLPFQCSCGFSFIPKNKINLEVYRNWSTETDTKFVTKSKKTSYSILNTINMSNLMYLNVFKNEVFYNQYSRRRIRYRANTKRRRAIKRKCRSDFLKDFKRIAKSYLNEVMNTYSEDSIEIDKLITDLEDQIRKIFDEARDTLNLSLLIAKNPIMIKEKEDEYWLIRHYMMNELSNTVNKIKCQEKTPFLIKYNSKEKLIEVKYNLVT